MSNFFSSGTNDFHSFACEDSMTNNAEANSLKGARLLIFAPIPPWWFCIVMDCHPNPPSTQNLSYIPLKYSYFVSYLIWRNLEAIHSPGVTKPCTSSRTLQMQTKMIFITIKSFFLFHPPSSTDNQGELAVPYSKMCFRLLLKIRAWILQIKRFSSTISSDSSEELFL